MENNMGRVNITCRAVRKKLVSGWRARESSGSTMAGRISKIIDTNRKYILIR